jgi:hypothetical protein
MANGFTYCWSDHATSKVYVGVHKGDPDDGYICSSKSMLEEYAKRPDDFTRQILFAGPYDICSSYEIALIKGLMKTDYSTFYNRSAGKKILFNDEIKNKIREKATGRKMSEEAIENNRLAKLGNTFRKGSTHTEESKQKMSEAQKGRVSPNKGKKYSDEHKLKLSLAHKGKQMSDEHRLALSIAAKKDWAKRKGLGV